MGLFDFLQRDRSAATAPAGAEQAELARVRAKRRLIGAVVLLGIGVVAFPLLFETQPRPIPVDIPIQIPSREGAPPLALPAPAKPVATASAPAPKVAAAPAPVEPAPAKVAAAEPPLPSAKAEPAPAKVEPAPKAAPVPAKVEPAPKAAATEANGRFVVQVGAFAEASAVREARSKVEKLGLSTYTQQVDTSSGPRTRVRLGPFATREDADKAAAKLKAAGLPGAVLTL